MYCIVKSSLHKRIDVFNKYYTYFGIILRYLLSFWNADHRVPHFRKGWIIHTWWEHLLLCKEQHLRKSIPSISGKHFTFYFGGGCKLFKIILSLCHCLWLLYGKMLLCFMSSWWLILLKYDIVSLHICLHLVLSVGMPCPSRLDYATFSPGYHMMAALIPENSPNSGTDCSCGTLAIRGWIRTLNVTCSRATIFPWEN